MTLKYEFDTMEELQEAVEHLEDYHDCKKCHGKMVCITTDDLGNNHCGYCHKIVRYPKMKKEAFEKWLREDINSK